MPDHYPTMVVSPIAVDRTHERFDFWFLKEPQENSSTAAARQAAMARWIATNREDVEIVCRLQRGRSSPGFAGGVLTRHWERPVEAFQRMVALRMRLSG